MTWHLSSSTVQSGLRSHSCALTRVLHSCSHVLLLTSPRALSLMPLLKQQRRHLRALVQRLFDLGDHLRARRAFRDHAVRCTYRLELGEREAVQIGRQRLSAQTRLKRARCLTLGARALGVRLILGGGAGCVGESFSASILLFALLLLAGEGSEHLLSALGAIGTRQPALL